MDRLTGQSLSGDEHLRQSVADILTTPIGTRPMRRDYGSLLFELVDRPFNAATRLLCVVATAQALALWEPRIAVRQVLVEGEGPAAIITVIGARTDAPAPNALTRLTIPLR